MKTLKVITPTPEQRPLISLNKFGVEVICGAAGSGKTTTALLRLRSLYYFFVARNERLGIAAPVKILVLTFNKTLAGYIRALVDNQLQQGANIDLCVETFSRWVVSNIGNLNIQPEYSRRLLFYYAEKLNALTPEYIVKEVDYVLGRFLPEEIEQYIVLERTGRGASPRVDRNLRRRIIDEVILPYKKCLQEHSIVDWNDLPVIMANNISPMLYDIVIVDESQDFSANQLRAIKKHLSVDHTVTFVIDTVQRVYARGFTWSEAGFDVRSERSFRLNVNYRNTKQIAAFAASILEGISVDSEGSLPNLNAAISEGEIPIVIRGFYSAQVKWAINYIQLNIDLRVESVAFLKPRGETWFKELRLLLSNSDLRFVDITREDEWPEGNENIALSTFHSSKGLEFDYVFILGLCNQNTFCAEEDFDDEILVLRRLLAVAVARARKAVIIGYKPGEESKLIQYFRPGTFRQIEL